MTATIPRTAYTYVPATGVTPDLTNHQVAHAGVMQDIDDTLAAVTQIIQGGVFFNVRAYGALGNGTHDDTTAIAAADTAAWTNGGYVLFPPGTYKFTAQITQKAPWCGSGVAQTILNCTTALGAGIPAIIMGTHLPLFTCVMRDIQILGPGPRSLGVKTANCNGIRIDAAFILQNVNVSQFDAGLVWNSWNGHISLINCTVGDNYYGIYDILDNGDNLIFDSVINGNTFANFAAPNNTVPCNFMAIRSHFGFAPYAFYQEDGGTQTWFLAGVTLIACKVEFIGNGVIYSASASKASPGTAWGNVTDFEWDDCGHSWSTTDYRLVGVAHDYAIDVGAFSGWIRGRASQIGPGAVGTIRCNFTGSPVILESGSGQDIDITVTSGTNNDEVFVFPGTNRSREGTGTIAAGTTSVTIQTSFWCGPTASLHPVVTPTGVGGLSGAFTLYVDTISDTFPSGSPWVGHANFTVHVLGGTPGSNLTFDWRIR